MPFASFLERQHCPLYLRASPLKYRPPGGELRGKGGVLDCYLVREDAPASFSVMPSFLRYAVQCLMSYVLLTGATGLLGAYLLRDAQQHDLALAVIARSSPTAGKARQRIENQMVRWERLLGHALPRPVVLEGDLTRSQLGLTSQQCDWIAENCSAVLHNAASLTFVAREPGGEPYRSNVEGVRQVLRLCEQTGITQFHHVSTAYVCGLRGGTAFESELDVGQKMGNDYERSKLQAEKFVREAEHLTSRTIYRPAIIIGDASNGYTSTFHGLYVPLKAAFGLAQAIASGEDVDLSSLLNVFTLDGTEKKNFVPVDWVSGVMMEIVANPRLHGQTYHLAPTQRTEVGILAEVIQESLHDWFARNGRPGGQGEMKLGGFLESLKEQMEVYRSYWRDDPIFDTGNTQRAVPHRPAPVVDRAMLKRMCGFAIRSNFGWPKSPAQVPKLDGAKLFDRSTPLNAQNSPFDGERFFLGMSISGCGGGDWCVELRNGAPVVWSPGLRRCCAAVVRTTMSTLDELLTGRLAISDAISTGRLFWELGESSPDPQRSHAEQPHAEQIMSSFAAVLRDTGRHLAQGTVDRAGDERLLALSSDVSSH